MDKTTTENKSSLSRQTHHKWFSQFRLCKTPDILSSKISMVSLLTREILRNNMLEKPFMDLNL